MDRCTCLCLSVLFVFENHVTCAVISIVVTSSDEPGWLRATLDNVSGLVPENYIELLS